MGVSFCSGCCFEEPVGIYVLQIQSPELLRQYVPQVVVGREYRQDGLLTLAKMAVSKYGEDVRAKKFPDEDYSYHMTEAESKALQRSPLWKA